ncbi:MAG: porin family protein [Acidobacteriota bacterium]|nr:porin family protein [Acidobacteriota bacterium]
MKKFITSVVVVCFLFLLAGRATSEAGIQFGLRGGVNSAKLTGADASDLEGTIKNKAGLVAGVFLAINLGKIITIEPEVLYTMKGSKVENIQGEYTGKIYGDYLEIPVLLKIRIPAHGVQPTIFAGPSVGFKLREKFSNDSGDVTPEEKLLANNDYGAVFGAGLDFGRHFMIDIRYSLGLKKVSTIIDGETSTDLKNGVWSATIGLAF